MDFSSLKLDTSIVANRLKPLFSSMDVQIKGWESPFLKLRDEKVKMSEY